MNLTPENVAKIEAALEIAARFVNRGSDSDCIASARRAMAETKELDATPAQIEQARAEYGSDEIEIDDCASTSPAPDSGGTWVAAWVWLADTEGGN